MVLCFVEFVDPKCALTAMEALQGIIYAISMISLCLDYKSFHLITLCNTNMLFSSYFSFWSEVYPEKYLMFNC